tara:strand:- start:2074 stop:2934 length:861 start_codon:yes stop_codon:yes gene_type:complete
MNKHLKELLFIILSISPLLIMSILSNLVEVPSSEISYEGLDRKVLMLSNSFLLFFFLVPYFAIKNNNNYLMNINRIKLLPAALVIISTLFFIVLNAPVIEWNKSISFPDFMSSFESWALLKEKQLESLTVYLVSFENNFEYIIGIFAIALIPGFCEEYFFRGILQKNFNLLIKNSHVAILLSSLLFSAFHLQFYGFFPRLFLGIFFGYLFYWSGSLIYPVIAHVFNNFLSLTVFYAANNGFFGKNFDVSVNSSPDIPLAVIALSIIIFIFLVTVLKEKLEYTNESG